MYFAVAGINHQPLEIRGIDELLQQGFPYSSVAPTAKSPMGVLPVAVACWQVTPRSACPQYPENRIDKFPVVAGDTAPSAGLTRQMGLKQCPNPVGNVMSVCGFSHKIRSMVAVSAFYLIS